MIVEWEPENHWDEHVDWPSEDWRYQVNNGDTRQGYVAWVNSQIEQAAEEPAKFNHAYSFGFEVMSSHPEAEDVTAQMLVEGLRHRIDRIVREDVSEMLNACDWFDVMEEPST